MMSVGPMLPLSGCSVVLIKFEHLRGREAVRLSTGSRLCFVAEHRMHHYATETQH